MFDGAVIWNSSTEHPGLETSSLRARFRFGKDISKLIAIRDTAKINEIALIIFTYQAVTDIHVLNLIMATIVASQFDTRFVIFE